MSITDLPLTPDLPRLRRARDLLDGRVRAALASDVFTWSMGYWGEERHGRAKLDAMGALATQLQEDGWNLERLPVAAWLWTVVYTGPDGRKHEGMDGVRTYFGLTPGQAGFLFDPMHYAEAPNVDYIDLDLVLNHFACLIAELEGSTSAPENT